MLQEEERPVARPARVLLSFCISPARAFKFPIYKFIFSMLSGDKDLNSPAHFQCVEKSFKDRDNISRKKNKTTIREEKKRASLTMVLTATMFYLNLFTFLKRCSHILVWFIQKSIG